MKRKISMMVAAGLICVLFCGCKNTEVPADVDKKREIQEEPKEEENYTFRDVEGNVYEAPLLQGVSKNTHDYNRLLDKDGFKYYTDSEENHLSKVGIDVSKYQADVDWGKVKESGIEFVMIRLGFRGYGEPGAIKLDECFKSHMEGAINAGLEVGVYFFSQAVSKEEATEEAQFVLEQIQPYKLTYPVVYDTEEIKNDTARTDNLTKEQYTEYGITFCETVKAAGYEPMIYANMKWLAFMLDLEKLTDYKIWYADYEEKPQNPYEIQMWQYTESGSVPGIEGNVDINILF